MASAALWFLRHQDAPHRRDCSGLVIAVLKRVGITERGGTHHIWQRARAEKRLAKDPRPGDLAFFDNTYDANRNGKVDDPFTHVAIVISVGPKGRIRLVHRGGRGIKLLHMNLAFPHQHRRNGRVANDFLGKYRPINLQKKRLTAELFRDFSRPPAPKQLVSVPD